MNLCVIHTCMTFTGELRGEKIPQFITAAYSISPVNSKYNTNYMAIKQILIICLRRLMSQVCSALLAWIRSVWLNLLSVLSGVAKILLSIFMCTLKKISGVIPVSLKAGILCKNMFVRWLAQRSRSVSAEGAFVSFGWDKKKRGCKA